jgi:hypothetical protein
MAYGAFPSLGNSNLPDLLSKASQQHKQKYHLKAEFCGFEHCLKSFQSLDLGP